MKADARRELERFLDLSGQTLGSAEARTLIGCQAGHVTFIPGRNGKDGTVVIELRRNIPRDTRARMAS